MFFDFMNSMLMNILVAPKLMRALTNMGVLLSMVLRHSGMSVPLWSEVDRIRKGISEGCSGCCSGMTFSVLGSMVTGDCGVLCHHSPRWISLTSGQDPLYSDGNLCLYMWHCLLQTLAINTPGLVTPPIHFTSAQLLLLSKLSHSQVTSLAHP